MPTYRSITLSLVSQYDILTIPEFPPPPSALPAALTSLVQTYIPTYPSSQFWLTYSIAGPHPPGLLYYFKLFLNGAHVISWGVGEEERFRGKTVFALFDAGDGLWSAAGRRTRLLEKRAFCFGPDGDDEGAMEVRVFRAGGRKKERISSAVRPMQEVRGEMMSGISLIPSGLAPDTAPKRYYKYALIDPLDAPFATFRYLYRSWEKLESLGVPLETHASAASSSGTSSLTSTITASVDEEEANRARTPSPPRHFGKIWPLIARSPSPSKVNTSLPPARARARAITSADAEDVERFPRLWPLMARSPSPAKRPAPSPGRGTRATSPADDKVTSRTPRGWSGSASGITSRFPTPPPLTPRSSSASPTPAGEDARGRGTSTVPHSPTKGRARGRSRSTGPKSPRKDGARERGRSRSKSRSSSTAWPLFSAARSPSHSPSRSPSCSPSCSPSRSPSGSPIPSGSPGAGGGPTPSPFGDTRRGRSPEMSTSKTTDRSSSRSKPRVSALRDVVASAVRRRQLRRRGMDEERSEREREVREREGGEISPLRL